MDKLAKSFTKEKNIQCGVELCMGRKRNSKTVTRLAVLDKILHTKISGSQTIYPGQTDTITVLVKDYSGKPAANVNLTAVSYNSQFKQDIRVSEPNLHPKIQDKKKNIV